MALFCGAERLQQQERNVRPVKPYLQPAYLSPPPLLEITEAEYLLLKNSRLVLNAGFSFEENYDLLIGNYLEFENAALSLATSAVARQLREYREMFELRAEMNRRAVNFLSSARLFVDQLPQRVGECGGDKDEVKEHLRAEYDTSFEYRFMEALRNHVQHSGSAVHSLRIDGKWAPPRENTRREFVLEVHTQRQLLALDPAFKKAVLKECPEDVDTLHATRRYLESLGAVHDLCRGRIDKKISEARALFEEAIEKYVKFSEASATGLTAFSPLERGPSSEIAIFLDWDDVRVRLSKRNGNLKNLSNCMISSVIA